MEKENTILKNGIKTELIPDNQEMVLNVEVYENGTAHQIEVHMPINGYAIFDRITKKKIQTITPEEVRNLYEDCYKKCASYEKLLKLSKEGTIAMLEELELEELEKDKNQDQQKAA